ncbi:MAG: DUF2946 domain-containing protein [Burkholderiaceae bacterium]|jgi:hypothetical protein
MPYRRLTRRFACWMAVLAVLMAALAPAISHALGTTGATSWTEVCTAQGSRWVQEDGARGGDPAPGAQHAFEHCPYCSFHSHEVGIPPAPLRALPASEPAPAVPQAFLAAPRTLHAWLSAQPRAPPLFS